MIITIDGPAASGKSSVAAALAHKLGFFYLNSGLLFRSAAYLLLTQYVKDEKEVNMQIVEKLCRDWKALSVHYIYIAEQGPHIIYKNENITSLLKAPLIDRMASIISQYKTLRDLLYHWQKELVGNQNAVVEGRDSGSVVFSHATMKIFLTASIEERAHRWRIHQHKQGNNYSEHEARIQIEERDRRDMTRALAPLESSHATVYTDTTGMTIDEVVELLANKALNLNKE